MYYNVDKDFLFERRMFMPIDFSYILDIGKVLEDELIQTSRVYIRRFKEEDLEDFCDYATSRKLCRDLGWLYMDKKEEAESFFKSMNLKTGTTFAIIHKESGKVIGNFGIGLFKGLLQDPILIQMRGITFSFALSEKYHNQGIMTELLKSAVSYMFHHNLVDYINCGYFHFNDASRRVQEKVGFHAYGQHYIKINGEEILTIENLMFRFEVFL